MQPVRILLVDDDEDDFILTRDILNESPNRQSYELTWCNNYSDAINAMLKSFYDVYLVDYRLGKHTGVDLLHEAIRSNCTEPIIILTGKGDLKIDQEAMNIGAADYLVKDSIDAPTLERSIRYSLEHSHALRDLKASEYKFRIIFERSKDPMIVSDMHGKHYDANPAALKYLEVTREEFLASASNFYASAEGRGKFIDAMEAQGSVTDLELQLQLPNGKTKYCIVSAFLQVSQHATTELYHSILHDLTYRKQQEQESVITEKLAVSERIAKSLADEIRNPLSNVNFALDEIKLNLGDKAGALQMYVDIIKENCDRINRLTTEFIASTEPRELVFKDLNVSGFLQEIISEAQLEYQVRIIDTPVSDELHINADAEKLKHAIMNLIQNSSESMSDHNRNIYFNTESKPDKLLFEVRDSGAGIAQENLTKVFEPFYTTKSRASGLGLTYAQRIVNAHGGVLTVESERENGTSAVISIPFKER